MRVLQVIITPSDVRNYRIEDGYRYGVYLESDQPPPRDTRKNLIVYRVPLGMTAPLGRIPDDLLLALAEDAKKPVAQPEVKARLPYWSEITENALPIEVPDDSPTEDAVTLPASLQDGQGFFIQPPDALKALTPKAAAKAAEKPPEPVKAEKGG